MVLPRIASIHTRKGATFEENLVIAMILTPIFTCGFVLSFGKQQHIARVAI
jgi:hypothetical protein